MAGYSATLRLHGATPRLATVGRRATREIEPRVSTETPGDSDRGELPGNPEDGPVADWLVSARETWAQTTFFLFDPNSWR